MEDRRVGYQSVGWPGTMRSGATGTDHIAKSDDDQDPAQLPQSWAQNAMRQGDVAEVKEHTTLTLWIRRAAVPCQHCWLE